MNDSKSPTVVVIMTTFNRKEITIRCLRTLFNANSKGLLNLEVVLVDASSSDGTLQAVNREFPEIITVTASSDTYWAQGMLLAWEQAQSLDYDAICWLNDDVVLHQNALEVVLSSTTETAQQAIIVGAFEDPETKEPTYGGALFGPRFRRLSMKPATPCGVLTPIDAANGNLVWVPREIDRRLGGFPSIYTHGIADNAFTLEARKQGIDVFLSPSSVGSCARNSIAETWQDRSLTAKKRLALLNSPKGLPFREYWQFCLRYGGFMGPIYALKPFVTTFCEMLREAAFHTKPSIIER